MGAASRVGWAERSEAHAVRPPPPNDTWARRVPRLARPTLANKAAQAFDLMRVELEGLAVAHWHIGMFCDSAIGVLQDLGRQGG